MQLLLSAWAKISVRNVAVVGIHMKQAQLRQDSCDAKGLQILQSQTVLASSRAKATSVRRPISGLSGSVRDLNPGKREQIVCPVS
jgi:hypothetical protein